MNKEKIINTDLLIDETDGKKCTFIGAGLDSLLMHESDKYRNAQWRGSLRYIPSLVNAIRVKKNDLQMRIDGVGFGTESSKMIYIGKHQIAAYYVPVFPHARLDDGKLYCLTLNKYFLSKHKLKGKRIEVKSSSPILIERDGEVIGERSSFSVHVEKGARRILNVKL